MTNAISYLTFLATGCGSMALHGATVADRDYARDQRGGFRVVGCTRVEDDVPVAVPPATYQIVADGPTRRLFEHAADGTGAVVDNTWDAEDGEHYFAWVSRTGWEFVVGKDKPPIRLVYANLNMSSLETSQDGSVRPTGKPDVTCAMEAL